MIAIIEYGMGNVGSIRNMLAKVGHAAVISSDPATLRAADALILPGVGAFDHGMANLHQRGLVEVLNECALQRSKPILGICLGMQLLTHSSEEGTSPGLGWIDARTVRFAHGTDRRLRVPHMGWNRIRPKLDTCESPLGRSLFSAEPVESRFYFVHSYHAVCQSGAHVLALAEYGYEFAAAIASGNIAGTQFHPEKSHRYGADLLRRFAEFVTLRRPAPKQ
jgi:glutamine amidotransferase